MYASRMTATPAATMDEGTAYTYRPSLLGAAFEFKLSGDGIDYAAGKIADYEFSTQVIAQCKAVLVTLLWSGIGSALLYKFVDLLVGLRVTVEEEREGLDISEHGERAYAM